MFLIPVLHCCATLQKSTMTNILETLVADVYLVQVRVVARHSLRL